MLCVMDNLVHIRSFIRVVIWKFPLSSILNYSFSLAFLQTHNVEAGSGSLTKADDILNQYPG